MTGFENALEFVLSFEGGHVNDLDDPGGETNFGISKRAYPDLDVGSLTREQAATIYRFDYWAKCQCDRLPWELCIVVFDEAVNQGVRAASSDLQEACGAKVDGIIGPATLEALGACGKDMKTLAEDVTSARMERYRAAVARRPELAVFMRGWMRRALTCLAKATEDRI